MIIDTDSMKSVGLAVTAAGGAFAVLVRPRIPARLWAKLGVVGELFDVLCGNYGYTANVAPDDGKAVALPADAPK